MLRAFPFRTFDEIAELGLEVSVYCPSCYRDRGPIDLTDERLRGRLFAGTRFVCSAMRSYGSAVAPRACGSLGHIIIRPPARDRVRAGQSIPWCSISCPRCVPTWEVNQAAKHLPPWDKIWTERGVQLACPACRSALTTSWQGGDGIPFTDGYRTSNEGPR